MFGNPEQAVFITELMTRMQALASELPSEPVDEMALRQEEN
jgi:hypothetical protein